MAETRAKILIVDDERSIRLSLSCLLAEIGYQVQAVEDGFSALIQVAMDPPDILLSDLNMPGMSGFELLAAVRRHFPSIRTIAMSGTFRGNEAASGVAADAFYEKGSSIGALLRIVDDSCWHERRPAGEESPASSQRRQNSHAPALECAPEF